MRILTKASRASCNLDIYTAYLLSEPHYSSCTRLSEILKSVSHDSINRFLERERYEPKDLFNEGREKIELVGGTLNADDSVLDKPYSDSNKAAFIDYFWSGKHKRPVKGINLISLFYTDIQGISVPVNYRKRIHAAHWTIERFHRAIKQVCNIERFQVRRENQIRNHIFCALKAFFKLEFLRFDKIIPHWYDVQKNLFVETIRNFIANPQKYLAVNA